MRFAAALNARLLLLLFCLLPLLPVRAGGPPDTIGHLDIELLDTAFRVTLGLPYAVAQSAAGFSSVTADAAFSGHLFARTLGAGVWQGDGVACRWEQPVSVASFAVIRVQALAVCESRSRWLDIELPLLEKAAQDFFVTVRLHDDGAVKEASMSRDATTLRLPLR